MIQKFLNEAHKSAQHDGDSVIIDIISKNNGNKPVVERRPCTCILLLQALKENNIANMLFRDLNEPTLRLVFEELAAVPSYVVETFTTSAAVADSASAAVTEDGRVVTWGNMEFGGDSSGVAGALAGGVVEVVATGYSFAALKESGRVVTWGHATYGGNSSSVEEELASSVVKVVATDYAFAALTEGGRVVTWGEEWSGGDSSKVAEKLAGEVVDIVAISRYKFAALKKNGQIVEWGGD